MKDEHIIEILDSAPLSRLSLAQLEVVRSHSKSCSSCATALHAASVSSAVIKERAQVVVEPSPFFQTKVLAALRERQAAESVPVLLRLWKSAGALAASMAVTTAALAGLSFMVPPAVTPTSDQTASAYSVESVMLDQDGDDQMSYEQVLSTIYADEEETK
jgi:hypothetical protein